MRLGDDLEEQQGYSHARFRTCVRNLRVAGEGELRVGRRTETFQATELDDHDKVEVLRAYLGRWKAEVGIFFDGVSAKSSDSDILRIAANHPVFQLTP